MPADAGHPVYWVGERPGTQIEVAQQESGNIVVRYLTGGAQARTSDTGFLTIGTYPLADPEEALDNVASAPDAIIETSSDETRLVSSESTPGSVYFAAPDNDVQVEVYDPRPGEAMNLAPHRPGHAGSHRLTPRPSRQRCCCSPGSSTRWCFWRSAPASGCSSMPLPGGACPASSRAARGDRLPPDRPRRRALRQALGLDRGRRPDRLASQTQSQESDPSPLSLG